MSDRSPHRHMILTHVVAVSLTPLIPIPFADDIAATGFRRRLIRKLSEAHGVPLSEESVRRLADRPGTSLAGHAGRILSYPIRRIFRKIFFVLEWKRALDTLGEDTLRAALLEHALAARPASVDAPRLAAAIDRTVAQADRGLFHRTARAALSQSTRLVRAGVETLARGLRSRFASTEPAAAERALDNLEGTPSALDQLTDLLDRIVDSLPADYLPALRAAFDREWAQA